MDEILKDLHEFLNKEAEKSTKSILSLENLVFSLDIAFKNNTFPVNSFENRNKIELFPV